MITDTDPYPSSPSEFAAATATHAKPGGFRSLHRRFGGLDQRRADRESAFEKIHGSLWQRGLLDRLTSPLTHYHE
jgi:hypothetical protein